MKKHPWRKTVWYLLTSFLIIAVWNCCPINHNNGQASDFGGFSISVEPGEADPSLSDNWGQSVPDNTAWDESIEDSSAISADTTRNDTDTWQDEAFTDPEPAWEDFRNDMEPGVWDAPRIEPEQVTGDQTGDPGNEAAAYGNQTGDPGNEAAVYGNQAEALWDNSQPANPVYSSPSTQQTIKEDDLALSSDSPEHVGNGKNITPVPVQKVVLPDQVGFSPGISPMPVVMRDQEDLPVEKSAKPVPDVVILRDEKTGFLRIISEDDVYILSFRSNGTEVFWHQEGEYLIPDQADQEKENDFCLVYLTEKSDGSLTLHHEIIGNSQG